MTEVRIGDRVRMRKQHPCGSDEWIVFRVGADVGMRCAGCERRVMLTRRDFNRNVKMIIASDRQEDPGGPL